MARAPQTISTGTTILRLKAVVAKTGVPTSGIYKLMDDGEFPKPIVLSAGRVGWIADEVEAWLKERIEATRQQGERTIRVHRRRPTHP
jgi:prophage regulatory protein